jgi:hypothetical protein
MRAGLALTGAVRSTRQCPPFAYGGPVRTVDAAPRGKSAYSGGEVIYKMVNPPAGY